MTCLLILGSKQVLIWNSKRQRNIHCLSLETEIRTMSSSTDSKEKSFQKSDHITTDDDGFTLVGSQEAQDKLAEKIQKKEVESENHLWKERRRSEEEEGD